MTHKHAYGTRGMSLDLFFATVTEHMEKKCHEPLDAKAQKQKSIAPTVFDRWAMKKTTEWETSVLYNGGNAVRTTAREPSGKKHKSRGFYKATATLPTQTVQ